MSSEWETKSYETMTHMLFKGSPVRKKINLIGSFSSIPFSVFLFVFLFFVFFPSVPCSLSHVGACLPGTRPCVHFHDESPKLKGFRAIKESLQGQAVSLKLMIHLWTQNVTKSCA